MEGLYGKRLDGVYRVDELLGRGGMGTVYKAHDESLQRDVAIKVLHPHFAEDPDFRARFQQEARAIAALDHPDIVRVFAFGKDLGLLYIVMDFVPGQTLQQWLKRLADERKIVALSESLTIARRLARALHYAHEVGVLHRDVKPGNILLKPLAEALRDPGDPPFSPVLTDFGLAKLAEGGVHTMTGTTMGTPAYMSPEQCLGQTPDRRSDIYSLGVILFELTTGRVPFEVKSLTEAIRCHTQEPPPPPRSVNPALPVEVENVVLRALAKRLQDRYPTAREMAADLRRVLTAVPPGLHVAPVSEPQLPTPEGYRTRIDGQSGTAATDPSLKAYSLDFPPGTAISVQAGDGHSRRIEMQGRRALAIGRAEDCDLCLPDSQVSRRHARIEFDGRRATVVDLSSTNGTFIGDGRLLPGIAQAWLPGAPLRIGSSTLHLELGQVAPSGRAFGEGETVVGLTGSALGAAGGRIALSSETFALTVQPGGSADLDFAIMNRGTVVDHFETRVDGIPASWTPVLPPLIRLLPNEEHDIHLSLRPPRSPQSRARRYGVTVRVISQDAPDQVAALHGSLTVTAFYTLDVTLQPQKQTSVARGEFDVLLHNGGNADLTVQLDAVDPESACSYTFTPARAIVPPEEAAHVRLEVRARAPLPGETQRLYPFTVNLRPIESPELARSAQGQWVQIAPSFEVRLRPQRQSGVTAGAFQVQIRNTSVAPVELELEAADPEDACTYTFSPARLTAPPGGDVEAQLEVRPRIPLPGETARTYAFTVAARPVDALGSSRQAQGQWVQIAPSFEVRIQPPQGSGPGRGTFQVVVSNQSIADIDVTLQAAGAQDGCDLTLSQNQLAVPASADRRVQLAVAPGRALRGKEPLSHPITVTVQPAAGPRFSRQAQAEWVQTPVQRSLWLPFLLSLAAWILAWIIFWGGEFSDIERIVFGLRDLGLPRPIPFLLVWAIRGALTGAIGGVGTGLALKWGEPAFGWGRAIWVALVWTAAWALGVAVTPLTGLPFAGGLLRVLVWAVAGAAVGLIAGWITGGSLRRAHGSMGAGQVFLIALGWAFGWALGHAAVESIGAFGLKEELHWAIGPIGPVVVLGLILGGLGALIGAGITFLQLGRANRRM